MFLKVESIYPTRITMRQQMNNHQVYLNQQAFLDNGKQRLTSAAKALISFMGGVMYISLFDLLA